MEAQVSDEVQRALAGLDEVKKFRIESFQLLYGASDLDEEPIKVSAVDYYKDLINPQVPEGYPVWED